MGFLTHQLYTFPGSLRFSQAMDGWKTFAFPFGAFRPISSGATNPCCLRFRGANLGAFKRPNQILISPGVNGYDLRGK